MRTIVNNRSALLTMDITKKYLVSVTGIFLTVFIIVHVCGNITFLIGPELFNRYSHALTSLKAVVLLELVLLAVFAVHVLLAGSLALKNLGQRPARYAARGSASKRPGLISTTLIWQGLIILAFVVYHLVTVKWGPSYQVSYEGVPMRDLYRLTVDVFSDPVAVVGYCVVMLILGFHLRNGVAVFLQSLGVAPRDLGAMNRLAAGLAVLVVVCFVCEPVYAFLLLRGH